MLTLPTGFADLTAAFAFLFSKRVFQSMQVLLAGAVLASGKRTVTAVLRVMGLAQEAQFQTYHRVLNRAKWSALAGSRRLLLALIDTFLPSGPLIMGLDDTIERRRGAKIKAKGIYRDPVRSSHGHFVKASGLRWLCLMLLAPIPWAGRTWALPFMSVLSPSQRYYQKRGRRPEKLTDRARQMLCLVKRWLPHRSIVVVADSSFAALELLAAAGKKVCMITRLRLDAALYDPPAPRRPGARGRSPRKGMRLPTLQAVLDNPATVWQSVTIERWYSQGARKVDLASGTALWVSSGLPAVPLRWVLVRDPEQKFKPQAFLCTDETIAPAQILSWFVRRWQVEVTFEEARAHLGMETQRQWSDRAIARTTPLVLGLYSIVTLMARQSLDRQEMPVRSASWYRKEQATFSDTIALVRRCLWSDINCSMSGKSPDMVEIPRALFDHLTDMLSYAA
jgi:hypothetical protein